MVQWILLACLLVALERLASLVPSFGRLPDLLVWLAAVVVLILALLGKPAH